MPADVLAEILVVEPHLGSVVDRAKIQHQALALLHAGLEFALIPAEGMEARVADPAQRRLGRKRHVDRQWPSWNFVGTSPGSGVVKAKSPQAIERLPNPATKLRSRVHSDYPPHFHSNCSVRP
jgi:hypothetical protein